MNTPIMKTDSQHVGTVKHRHPSAVLRLIKLIHRNTLCRVAAELLLN